MSSTTSAMRRTLKSVARLVALVAVSPAALLSGIERRCSANAEGWFCLFAQLFALIPGYAGVVMRRAFYELTLDGCSPNCFIGFGSLFTHRRVRVGDSVSIGSYTLIGCATLGRGSLIGSRASLLSGPALHEPNDAVGWTPFNPSKLRQIHIGEESWIGEGAVVIADMGARSMAAAGSVVSAPVRAGVMVAGNPARFVRRVHTVDADGVIAGAGGAA